MSGGSSDIGFPFSFLSFVQWYRGGGPPVSRTIFSLPLLIVDIIIWYLVSCGIVALYKKYKKWFNVYLYLKTEFNKTNND